MSVALNASVDLPDQEKQLSHIHFGWNNDIRVATRRVLNPVSFGLFIVRQRYPREWERLVLLEQSESWCRNVRETLDEIAEKFWGEADERELALE